MGKSLKKGRALVVGSVAYDVIFDIHGKIKDSITVENGKPGRQNLMFTAKVKQQHFGGTGGNIAYGLGMLGVKPILFSAVGKDFAPQYQKHLKANGVDVRVHTEKENWTAMFIGMSDEAREQIGVWQPNAHLSLERISIIKKLGAKALKGVSVAIFSGAPSITYRHMKDARALLGKRAWIIFDPGKMMTTQADKALFKRGLKLADIFIVNDFELRQAEALLKCSGGDILNLGPKAVIETRGEKGSAVYEKGKTTSVPAFTPKRVVETTGAGDAYRAGLMYGLLHDWSLEKACRLGAKLGAKNVETLGGQNYSVSKKESHL